MGDIEEKSLAFLEKSIKQNKVFIDTCSILSEQADKFWGHVVPLLQREGKHIVVPKRVYEEVAKFAAGKKIGLFGSYGWGDGEWMRNWVKQMQDAGAEVLGGEDAICCDAPDDEAEEKLVELGKKLAE